MFNPSNQKSIGKSPQDRVVKSSDQSYANSQPYNTFDLSHSVPDTQRAADIQPFEFRECVPGDRLIISSSSQIKANQLPAPLQSHFAAYEDYFQVPLSCIYPVNYDKMIANPTKGDDIPLDALPSFPIAQYLSHLLFTNLPSFDASSLNVIVDGESYTLPGTVLSGAPNLFANTLASEGFSGQFSYFYRLNSVLRAMFLLSSDSLLHRCGYALDYTYALSTSDIEDVSLFKNYRFGDTLSLQELLKLGFDLLYNYLTAVVLRREDGYVSLFKVNSDTSIPVSQSAFGSYTYVGTPVKDISSMRDIVFGALETSSIFTFFVPVSSDSRRSFFNTFNSDFERLFSILQNVSKALFTRNVIDANATELPSIAYINPTRLVAYHLALAQYSSVDTVDYIFTSKLWMQNFQSLLYSTTSLFSSDSAGDTLPLPSFSYNGVMTLYDTFTVGCLRNILLRPQLFAPRIFGVFANLFWPARSLRYRDYFTSARPNVIAVGNLQIAQSNNVLFASDVTKGLVAQRFLNAVNRVGNKLVDYLAGIFGVIPRNVEAEPHFIARRKINIGSSVNVDHGSDLGREQSNLVSSGDTSGVDVYIDEESVIVAVRSFDVYGANVSGVDRHLMNFDRFQKFNPMFQNIGDQDIKLIELDGDVRYLRDGALPVFGYANRYAEYKEPVSLAHGGSLLYLPGWFYLRRFYKQQDFQSLDTDILKTIKPSLIRHSNADFDDLFAGSTTLDPAGYFHFVISQVTSITAVRKMNFFTSILWN